MSLQHNADNNTFITNYKEELGMLSAPYLMLPHSPNKPQFLALPAATCWAPAWCIRSAGP